MDSEDPNEDAAISVSDAVSGSDVVSGSDAVSDSDTSEDETQMTNLASTASPPRRRFRRTTTPRSVSWVVQHIKAVPSSSRSNSSTATLRRCLYCSTTFGPRTSMGTIYKHLGKQHHISKGGKPKPGMKQKSVTDALPLVDSRQLDTILAKFIVTSGLPHQIVAQGPFQALTQAVAPRYSPLAPITVKRRIIEMYIYLKVKLVGYFATLPTMVSMTFDGWSNGSLKGFYVLTLHWCDATTRSLHEIVLDFFSVTPGTGVGARCGTYMTSVVEAFGLSESLLVVVSDNGSDAVAAAKTLSACVDRDESPSVGHIRCYAHTFQLSITFALDMVKPTTAKLRAGLGLMRTGKARRQAFRDKAQKILKTPREPPCQDSPTRWNSTHKMVSQSIQLNKVIGAVLASDDCYKPYILEKVEWRVLGMVQAFLGVPDEVSTIIGTSKTCSLSSGVRCNDFLIGHCNNFVDDPNCELAAASEAMLHSLIGYAHEVNSVFAIVCLFLDLRVARDVSSVDHKANRSTVRGVLRYDRYAETTSTVAAPQTLEKTGLNIFGIQRLPGSPVDIELTRFESQPQLNKDENVIAWWVEHRADYPILYKLAMDFLSIPATSVPSERANSKAKTVFEDRESLGDAMFKAEMCVHSWLRLATDLDWDLPSDYLSALQDLKLSIDLQEMAEQDMVVQYYLDM